MDRFSRNKFEMAMHRKHLKDNGIKILSAMENIPDSPEGILLESLLEGMNQYYSAERFPDWISLIRSAILSAGRSHHFNAESAAIVSSVKRLRMGLAGTPPTMV